MKKIFLSLLLFSFHICYAQPGDSAFSLLPIEKNIRIHIAGQWKDQNSTMSFFNNGAYSVQYNNGTSETGSWKLRSSQLFLSANGTAVDEVYNVLFFNGKTMKTQLANSADTTIWIAIKVNKAADADRPLFLNDMVVISKTITNEIAGSAYRKRATQYRLANKSDTSQCTIIIIESNKNEFDHDGSVHLQIDFDKNKSYREQKAELAMLLETACKEYKFDSLKSIYSLWLPSLGDLNIKISKELETKDVKLIRKNYWKLNDFLLTSSLSKEINDIFKKYKLRAKQFSIEHFGYYAGPETLKRYSKIETDPADFPAKIIQGAMWIYFD